MRSNDFNELYQGVFSVDDRTLQLEKRLNEYYEAADNTHNPKEIIRLSRDFSGWCKDCGYTNKEVARAKASYNPNKKPA